MGYYKEKMLQEESNDDLKEFFRIALERDLLSSPVNGIALQMLDKGVHTLSNKQRYHIDNYVDHYTNIECEVCQNNNVASLCDFYDIHEVGICPTCQYNKRKFMED